jgi:hypothetical protein
LTQEFVFDLKWVFLLSVAVFVGAIAIVPLVVVRIPADYFSHERRGRREYRSLHPVLWWTWSIVRTVSGAALVLAGIAMLVLPGQGILTILAGLSLLEFPGKYRLERWIARRRPVLAAINGLRRRFGRDPLRPDSDVETPGNNE